MAEGAWVVLGAAIGSAGSLLTTALNAWLTRHNDLDRYDKAAMKLLAQMLEKGQNWRKLRALSNVIGATEQDTKELLLILGARASEANPELWGLVSRNPLPFPEKPSDPADPTLAY
ncbi:hypothetical protein [Bradyrhizobium sp. SZCCHNR1075]|uniref:hypothetical protein n=1 Tax=Bradyrhizobium sp. SZCCHNR1075 TaxID=3057362 RepID=UPI0028F046E9|nr:hypothetical protein [Bradyrhizobium sp. SZCCHNR1075]